MRTHSKKPIPARMDEPVKDRGSKQHKFPRSNGFRNALFISLIMHAVVLINLSRIIDFSPQKRMNREIKVSYKINRSPARGLSPQRRPPPFIPSKRMIKETISHPEGGKRSIPQFIEKAARPSPANGNISQKPSFLGPPGTESKKRITIPNIDSSRVKSPAYMSYYEIIREKIRKSAYQNYFSSETGNVYIAFTILSNGSISTVKTVDTKTHASSYLKEIAQKSVYSSAPFPPFPKDLDYPELSFNVVIAFEIE